VRRARCSAVASGQRGQATVELALVMPLIALALLAVVQTGLVVRDDLAVQHAAREGARAASVDPDPGAAAAAVRRVIRHASVTTSARPAVGGDITVRVAYRSHTDLPLVGPLFPDPQLHASATMRVER
jgi:Flp pilus assembly protein TadG